MDKRFKWPLPPSAHYTEPPYHHRGGGGGGGGEYYYKPHPNKTYSRMQQHGYANRTGASYYKPPPPPQALGRGGMPASHVNSTSSSSSSSSDVVTLIVENNNLKRMIVLHLQLMQDQTDKLSAKDKELDDQAEKLNSLINQNQELKLINAQLEASMEDLRKHLIRCKQRNDNDNDDDDPAVPPTQTKSVCHAGTQTSLELVAAQLPEEPRREAHKAPKVVVTSVTELPAAPPVVVNKVRGEFNGKKVSTMILHRVNQDSSLSSNNHQVQEEEPEEKQLEEQEEEQEEEGHLYEAYQPNEMEVVAEEEVAGVFSEEQMVEEEVVVEEEEIVQTADANGHVDQEEDEEGMQEELLEEEFVANNVDTHHAEELWQAQATTTPEESHPQIFDMDELAVQQEQEQEEEKSIEPTAHSTPNHIQREEPEKPTEKEPVLVEQLEVETVEISTKKTESVKEKHLENEIHSEKQLVTAKESAKAVPPASAPTPTPVTKLNSASITKAAPAAAKPAASPVKILANHQVVKPRTQPVETIKKQRLQVKIKQLEKKTTSTLDIEEDMRRRLAEHLQKQQQRQNQQPLVLPKKPQKESTNTSLIFPPIATVAASTITPAATPTTTPSSTPVSTPQPTPTSTLETGTGLTTTKANKWVATPLTPQSMSSVSSSSNSTSNRKTLNNCAPQTYGKSRSSGTTTSSRFRTAPYLYTTRSWEDQEFHCDNEFFLEEADELLADNPSLEIPKWRDEPVPVSSDSKGIEVLSDAEFERRHDKYVKDEIERKRRDARYIREQLRSEALRMRHNQDEVLVPLDPLPTSTFYPLPEDIEGILFVNEVPVQAFGENMVNIGPSDDFSLPWLDAAQATTAIAKAKAQAVPVSTLANKKLPSTAAEARHQEMNSSYVFLKRRKRQRRR